LQRSGSSRELKRAFQPSLYENGSQCDPRRWPRRAKRNGPRRRRVSSILSPKRNAAGFARCDENAARPGLGSNRRYWLEPNSSGGRVEVGTVGFVHLDTVALRHASFCAFSSVLASSTSRADQLSRGPVCTRFACTTNFDLLFP
jgi:hypothetical protein